jgi:hypothetical protein
MTSSILKKESSRVANGQVQVNKQGRELSNITIDSHATAAAIFTVHAVEKSGH